MFKYEFEIGAQKFITPPPPRNPGFPFLCFNPDFKKTFSNKPYFFTN